MSSALKTTNSANLGPTKRRKRESRNLDFSKLHPDQNLTEEEVCQFLAMSRSSLRNKLAVGERYYDPSFPRPHPLRGRAEKGCAIRWKAGLVIDWNRAQAHGENDGSLR
jgi:predicted DNA-binding transcriptional regulator AlpA